MHRPAATEYAPYYQKYVDHVTEGDVVPALDAQSGEVLALLRDVSEDEATERHPPYTWSTKQVVGHVTDSERVFAYRALRFARGDATPLPGFDENEYARAADFDRIPLKYLAAEFEAVRRASVALFRHLPAEAWARGGLANDNHVTVRALATIMVGHVRHHLAILRQRLGKA